MNLEVPALTDSAGWVWPHPGRTQASPRPHPGQLIGFVGQTGTAASGPHLDFEVRTPDLRAIRCQEPRGTPAACSCRPAITHFSADIGGTANVSATVEVASTDVDLNEVRVEGDAVRVEVMARSVSGVGHAAHQHRPEG